ncbi:MAG: ribosome maturation factor RimP [Alphaproteobacteria bacterium]|nr:ribosome maturation factor RimP [Alphaproteobacteria bacterium]
MVVKGQEQAVTVEAMITPTIEAMGYEVVRVMIAGGQSVLLQVMAERHDGKAMTVEDCAEISRTVSALLEVEDPITGPYRLEVSSPGIDRPLTKARDFERFAGHRVRVEAGEAIEGRRRFIGMLKGVQEGSAVMVLDGGEEAAVPLGSIVRAKLVLTDELLAAHKA